MEMNISDCDSNGQTVVSCNNVGCVEVFSNNASKSCSYKGQGWDFISILLCRLYSNKSQIFPTCCNALDLNPRTQDESQT